MRGMAQQMRNGMRGMAQQMRNGDEEI